MPTAVAFLKRMFKSLLKHGKIDSQLTINRIIHIKYIDEFISISLNKYAVPFVKEYRLNATVTEIFLTRKALLLDMSLDKLYLFLKSNCPTTG